MRNMEGASLNTVTAAYAPLLVDDYDPVLVRYGPSGTHLLTTGFGAVHTGMPGEEPVYLSVSFQFGELYPEPSVSRKLRGVFVAAPVLCLYPGFVGRCRYIFIVLVPLLASHLATPTSGTPCCII
jgi:hypothetical protein